MKRDLDVNDWVDFFEDYPEYNPANSDPRGNDKKPALDREQLQQRKKARDEIQAMLNAALLQNPLKKRR
jgi:hypothetical protein